MATQSTSRGQRLEHPGAEGVDVGVREPAVAQARRDVELAQQGEDRVLGGRALAAQERLDRRAVVLAPARGGQLGSALAAQRVVGRDVVGATPASASSRIVIMPCGRGRRRSGRRPRPAPRGRSRRRRRRRLREAVEVRAVVRAACRTPGRCSSGPRTRGPRCGPARGARSRAPAGRGAASAPISSALRRSTTVRTPWASSARQPAAVRRSSASARTSAPRRTARPSAVRRPPRSRTLKHPSQSSAAGRRGHGVRGARHRPLRRRCPSRAARSGRRGTAAARPRPCARTRRGRGTASGRRPSRSARPSRRTRRARPRRAACRG